MLIDNRPFPSSKKPHSQNEAKCKTFLVKISFICMIIKNHFHKKGFALGLVLKQRPAASRKWPIIVFHRYGEVKLLNVLMKTNETL